jgi:vacuolar-type H+-ATPase subunit F/Vma7
MARITYIGDEASAAGYRLAGAATRVPAPGSERAEVERAVAASDLVLIGAACARRLAPGILRSLLRQETPLVLVVPDATAGAPEELAARLRRALGF